MNKLKIAILSDLHPVTEECKEGSFLEVASEESEFRHPIAAIKNLADRENIKVDVVVCPGDFGNKASTQATEYGWGSLHKVKDYLGAKMLIVAPGNHDHDSRSTIVEYDPKYYLQSLSPSFPFSDHDLNTHFWAWHWAEILKENCRFIVLNTSAYHGIKNEHCHGRVANRTIEMISSKVNGVYRSLNFLICHHHPVKNEDIQDDYDSMKNGELLLSSLEKSNSGPWMVIHGHKHFPKIFYAQGSSSAPVIFSAGSFSACLHKEISSKVGNQFHVIELDVDRTECEGVCFGTFRTWDWSLGKGWLPAPDEKGLPYVGGFGNRNPARKIASEIKKILGEEKLKDGNCLYKQYPDLQFITPLDLGILKGELKSRHNIEIELERGRVTSLGVSS